jgi:hypothetical protein
MEELINDIILKNKLVFAEIGFVLNQRLTKFI